MLNLTNDQQPIINHYLAMDILTASCDSTFYDLDLEMLNPIGDCYGFVSGVVNLFPNMPTTELDRCAVYPYLINSVNRSCTPTEASIVFEFTDRVSNLPHRLAVNVNRGNGPEFLEIAIWLNEDPQKLVTKPDLLQRYIKGNIKGFPDSCIEVVDLDNKATTPNTDGLIYAYLFCRELFIAHKSRTQQE